MSVTMLAKVSLGFTLRKRHIQHWYRLFLVLSSWIFEKPVMQHQCPSGCSSIPIHLLYGRKEQWPVLPYVYYAYQFLSQLSQAIIFSLAVMTVHFHSSLITFTARMMWICDYCVDSKPCCLYLFVQQPSMHLQ